VDYFPGDDENLPGVTPTKHPGSDPWFRASGTPRDLANIAPATDLKGQAANVYRGFQTAAGVLGKNFIPGIGLQYLKYQLSGRAKNARRARENLEARSSIEYPEGELDRFTEEAGEQAFTQRINPITMEKEGGFNATAGIPGGQEPSQAPDWDQDAYSPFADFEVGGMDDSGVGNSDAGEYDYPHEV
jgi:hypothetical protein